MGIPSRRWRGAHFDFAQCERRWGVSAQSHSLPSVQPERSRRPRECLRRDGGACTSTSLSANGGGECRRDPPVCPPFSLSAVEGHGNPLAEMAGRAFRFRSVRTGWGRAIERPRSPAKAGAQLRCDRDGSWRRVGGLNRRVANASHEAVRTPATMGRLGPGLRRGTGGVDTKKGGRAFARPPFTNRECRAYAPAFFSAAWTSFQVIAP